MSQKKILSLQLIKNPKSYLKQVFSTGKMTDVQQIINDFKVCVVVPTYNNAGTITEVLSRILAVTHHVIVVIDGCTDDTRERIAGMQNPSVQVVDHAENHGKGHALLSGFHCVFF